MVAGKNYNILTSRKKLTSNGARAVIGGVVAAGQNRYVTFVRVTQDTVTNSATKGSRVLFLSATVSGGATMTLASAIQKLSVGIISGAGTGSIAASKSVTLPSQPDTKNPLFSIAAGAYLFAKLGSSAGVSAPCTVFVQYYDQ
jgi:hypothetical protein